MRNNEGVVIVYDGQCPFCSNYVRLVKLRRSVGVVKFVDARSNDGVIQELKLAGVDLNEGMAVVIGGKTYYGKDAVVLLSTLSDSGNFLGRIFAFVLKSPRRARILYPYMKAGRRMTLMLLGRQQIVGL
jgi:predicted DCC family thiol-disulfide oxidoreductase YuxK